LANQKKRKNQLRAYAKFSSIGLQMLVIIAAGSFFGVYLDKNTDTNYYTTTLSLVSVFVAIIFVLKKITHDAK
tara:strand:- start:792 stop:1010 length:219 start_codon:yes stop_codon:yes gene_type:complete